MSQKDVQTAYWEFVSAVREMDEAEKVARRAYDGLVASMVCEDMDVVQVETEAGKTVSLVHDNGRVWYADPEEGVGSSWEGELGE